MTSNLSEQLLRQVGRFGGVERSRLGQSGDNGASSLKRERESVNGKSLRRNILVNNLCSSHPVVPHELPQVINQSELLWIDLITVRKWDAWDFPSVANVEEAWKHLWGITGLYMCLLTALLSSFLMVDLPHRPLTPSTATAKWKSEPGCPLCSLSSFITAPTTSLLLFTRDIP